MSSREICPSKTSTTVLNLPFVFLEQIVSYLDGYDIFTLYTSGDKRVIQIMANFGAVKSIKLLFLFNGSVGIPFGFGGLFHSLTKFYISYETKRTQFYRYPDAYTDLCSLPPTLTDLHIRCENVLALFYERQALSLSKAAPEYSSFKSKYSRARPVCSTRFYNLDLVFPNLKSLSLSEKWQYFGLGSKEAMDDIISTAFIVSLPRGLENLKLKMGRSWPLQSLVQLPPSLRRLHLHQIHISDKLAIYGLVESTFRESLGLPPSTSESQTYAPFMEYLPPHLETLTIYGGLPYHKICQTSFPASLKVMKLKQSYDYDAAKKYIPHLPMNLKSFLFTYRMDLTAADIDLLPRSLTCVRLPQSSCLVPNPIHPVLWPAELGVLEMGITDQNQLACLQYLPHLHTLTLHGTDNMAGDPFWPDSLPSLPTSLQTLILKRCILLELDFALLPSSLTKFEMKSERGVISGGPASTYFVKPGIFPPSLLSLALICKELPNLDFSEMLSCVPRTVRSLEISLCQPTTNYAHVAEMPVKSSEVAKPLKDTASSHINASQHQKVVSQSNLTSLILRSYQAPAIDFYSILPRSLTKLELQGQARAAIPASQLPPGLVTLRAPCSKIDATEFEHLPKCLKTLHVRVYHNPEKKTISPSECAASLPISLTDLALFRSTINQPNWGEETFPHLPRTLLLLNLNELCPRFWSVCPDHLPRQIVRGLVRWSPGETSERYPSVWEKIKQFAYWLIE